MHNFWFHFQIEVDPKRHGHTFSAPWEMALALVQTLMHHFLENTQRYRKHDSKSNNSWNFESNQHQHLLYPEISEDEVGECHTSHKLTLLHCYPKHKAEAIYEHLTLTSTKLKPNKWPWLFVIVATLKAPHF